MSFFAVKPSDGSQYGREIHENSETEVNQIIERASAVASSLAALSPIQHSSLLRLISQKIESKRTELIDSACSETGLPEARIGGEITRTTVQFELFANLVESGEHLHATIDKADPQYSPAPRPDIRKMNTPLGTVAIFAASNFPLAFSVAGGDAASALAAGNAVVAKAHPSHPNTCSIVESAIKKALVESNLSADLYSIVQGRDPQISHWLALHPSIKAIGFTGSEQVGRILVNLGASRPEPIPVYAEMGSLNPVFVTSNAIAERGEALAKGLVDSALLGSGQFCTKPGLIFTPDDASFLATISSYVESLSTGPLLSSAIAKRYTDSISHISTIKGVEVLIGSANESGFGVTPTFFVTDWETAQSHSEILEEHFGPTTVIIKTKETDFSVIASSLSGQLTATIHGTDHDDISELTSVLKEKAGRVIWNGFPTGVAVTTAMQHGGPWPSSSTHTTSVGTDAIYRFLRPVSYQGFSQGVLPNALKDSNPWKIPQRIN